LVQNMEQCFPEEGMVVNQQNMHQFSVSMNQILKMEIWHRIPSV